jgi:hypothetical protein
MSELTGELPPADLYDPVIEAYKKDVDRTLLRENLKLTVEERLRKLASLWEYAQELRAAGRGSHGAWLVSSRQDT